jgi:hypothetical protein
MVDPPPRRRLNRGMKAKLYLICLFLFPFVSHAQLSSDLNLDIIDLENLTEANAKTEATFEEKVAGSIRGHLTKIRKLQKDFNAVKRPNEFLSRVDAIIEEEGELTTRFLGKEGELARIVAVELKFRETESQGWRERSRPPDSSPQERAIFERVTDEYEAAIKTLYDLEVDLFRLSELMSAMQRIERANLEYLIDVIRLKELKIAIQQIEELKTRWNEKINFQIEAINSFLDLLPGESKKQDEGKKAPPNP